VSFVTPRFSRRDVDYSQFDRASADWLEGLTGFGPRHDAAVADLFGLMLRVAGSEARRRQGQFGIAGTELNDLVHQAAADATLAVIGKLTTFRGESRFTTWACKFAIFEVGSKIGRHAWRHHAAPLGREDWDQLPSRFGLDPSAASEWGELVMAIRRSVDSDLTVHQRQIFVEIVLTGTPLDVLVDRLGTNRNAIYKTLFDARRKIRAALVAQGYLDEIREQL
jgi:RNA polymerase sigma-70 factor (ECF subfamily)